ncbi:MAG: SIMPL domain-containing protein [Treponema sp.]|nr:SIMPL domain-containing protein [Treponema sp.]
MKRFFSVILFFALFISCKVYVPQETPRTITVTGNGIVRVSPDHAVMSLAVITQNRIATVAITENERIVTQVTDALKEAGVRASDIATTEHRITQQNNGNAGRFVAGWYTVHNSILVTVQNIHNIGALIDTATAAGAQGLMALTFDIADRNTAFRQARTLAVQDAQTAATLFAGASGGTLGAVLALEEDTADSDTLPLRDGSVPDVGTITVHSTIRVTYALQ